MGWDRELDLVKTAHEMEMFCLEYAFTPEEARKIAEVGCPAISSHVGSTVGGARGAKTAITLDDAVRISQEIFDAARDVNPDIILFAHGGPMKGPKEVQYVLDNTNAQGFIGGSAAERMPIEKQSELQLRNTKHLNQKTKKKEKEWKKENQKSLSRVCLIPNTQNSIFWLKKSPGPAVTSPLSI